VLGHNRGHDTEQLAENYWAVLNAHLTWPVNDTVLIASLQFKAMIERRAQDPDHAAQAFPSGGQLVFEFADAALGVAGFSGAGIALGGELAPGGFEACDPGDQLGPVAHRRAGRDRHLGIRRLVQPPAAL